LQYNSFDIYYFLSIIQCSEHSTTIHSSNWTCQRLRQGLGLWCLMPLSTIFQLCRVSQFYLCTYVLYRVHLAISSKVEMHNLYFNICQGLLDITLCNKVFSDIIWQVSGFLWGLWFPLPRYNWNIVESGVKTP
jgi:hypothetical protein